MSLLELITAVRDLIAAVKAQNWPAVFTALSKILNAAAALFGPQTTFAAAEGQLDELESVCSELKACAAPQTAATADPKAIDPGTIIAIIQFATLVLEWIKKRRQG